MENENTNQIKDFTSFAEATLKNHLEELNTHYENREVESGELKQAYDDHEKIFDNELQEKMHSLLAVDDSENVKPSLEEIKKNYLQKLKSNQSKA